MESIAKAIVAVACLVFIGAGLTLGWATGWLVAPAVLAGLLAGSI